MSHTHILKLIAYYHSNQVVVWSNDKGCGSSQGVIIPITKVAGTVTRRAVESTWMTASNAKVGFGI